MRHFSYALLATSIVLIGAPAAIAQPSPLNITLDRPPLSALELGKQTGDKTCTGEGDAYTCVTPIGTQTALRDTVPALDNSTGSRGRLTVACTVMFSGTTTAYQTTTGTTEATGSQDCDLKFTFENGDAVFGAMHQTRVVQGTTQTSTFAFVFTGGAGKYDGFFGKFSTTEKSNWTPPPPLSEKGSKRLTTLRAGDGFAAISSRKTAGLKVKPTRNR